MAGQAVGDTLLVRVSRDGMAIAFEVEIADRAEIYPDTAEAPSFQFFR